MYERVHAHDRNNMSVSYGITSIHHVCMYVENWEFGKMLKVRTDTLQRNMQCNAHQLFTLIFGLFVTFSLINSLINFNEFCPGSAVNHESGHRMPITSEKAKTGKLSIKS